MSPEIAALLITIGVLAIAWYLTRLWGYKFQL